VFSSQAKAVSAMALVSALAQRRMRSAARRLTSLTFCALGALLLAAQARPADDPSTAKPPARGRLLRIPLPITDEVDKHVKQAAQRALDALRAPGGAERPVLVFEFAAPSGTSGLGSDFGRSLELAHYLASRELSPVKTVAYIPRAVKGHAVLPALACEEIVMAPDAQLGEAGIDEGPEVDVNPTKRAGYREIADERRTIPAEVALGMLDRNVELLKVETELSPEFILGPQLDELKKTHTIQSQTVLKRPGELAQFTGRQARELGFVKYLAADHAALAKALGLSPQALEDDPSLAGSWQPVRIDLKGPLTASSASRVQRLIENQIAAGANFLCLWIDSPGGSLIDSMNLVTYLAQLDPSTVRTVAYVPGEARADAALIAMACDQLVIGPDATLGGPGAAEFSPEDLQLAAEMLRQALGEKKNRSWSLPAALVDGRLRVFRYTHQPDGAIGYFSTDERQQRDDPAAWTQGEEVTKADQPLQLSGERARELGLARHVAGSIAGLRQIYGLEHELTPAEPGWAQFLIDALAAPAVAWMLLLIGGAALYAELQSPGIGVGAFVALVCFVLYFWSKHLDGTAGWLEVLLFVTGVACILLELFVLPGTAIFGLGGGLLIIVSLVLASQTFIVPHNEYQISQLQNSLLGLVGVGIGIVAAAMLMHRYLPHAPFFSNVMLEPPSGAELEDLEHREAIVELDHLLGRYGHATTQLTPSGKARFGSELVDVIADGEVIGRGAEVVVVEVQGNRVVVRTAS
jgi:membrane-bound ClpP family serine protease